MPRHRASGAPWSGVVVALVLGVAGTDAAAADAVRDGFEGPVLDSRIWSDRQIEPDQIAFSTRARCGDQAIAILTRTGDGGRSCSEDHPCQRAELRLHWHHWPDYGDEAWYGFSFRIEGDIPTVGSNRTVVGQWKAPNDDSPFVAQRFDNGVFHITVQDNNVRRTVASAEGDPDRLERFQHELARLGVQGIAGFAAIDSFKTYARVLRSPDESEGGAVAGPPGLGAAFPGSILGDAVAGALAEPEAELLSLFDEFAYLGDLERYAGPSELRVEPGPAAILPDPRDDWVDMVYRIKGGRTDNGAGPTAEGELDVWANGRSVVSVRGNLGYAFTQPPPGLGQYFKFGLYRDPIPGAVQVYFDEFAQGSSYDEVKPTCQR